MSKISALVLAAGLSSRMKTNKMLLEISGRTVIEYTLNNILASRIDDIKIVVGSQKESLLKQLTGYNVDIIYNPDYADGMSTSIKAGIRYLMRDSQVGAVLVSLGDMPLVKPETINCIVKVKADTGSHIVVPVYKGRRGHPVLFDKIFFGRLLELSGDMGAREIIKKYHDNVNFLEVQDSGVLTDIDSREDYLRITKYFNTID